jgi:hypothetical protein
MDQLRAGNRLVKMYRLTINVAVSKYSFNDFHRLLTPSLKGGSR